MIKSFIKRVAEAAGYEIVRRHRQLSPAHLDILEKVRPYTMTGTDRVAALIAAVDYLSANRIEGDVVECGVWRGGSMMAAALALKANGDTARTLHLFDTFEGMTAPTAKDADRSGTSAQDLLDKTARKEGGGVWAYATYEDVVRNMATTGYPSAQVKLVRGRVEDTIPAGAPDKIALLRLDTDWYESTKHELEHLYPRLVPNGVLIIDDYGHWVGAKQAVDEFFAAQTFKPLMNPLDYSGRLIIKTR